MISIFDRLDPNDHIYISDVREACAHAEQKLIIRIVSCEGEEHRFVLGLPDAESCMGKQLRDEYILGELFNTVSVLGAEDVCIYAPGASEELMAHLKELSGYFESHPGYSKVLRISGRIGRLKGLDAPRISVSTEGLIALERRKEPLAANISEKIFKAAEKASEGLWLGLDIGGSDIKLILYSGGHIEMLREYDWDPEHSPRAELISGPVLQLIKDCARGRLLDGIGISFPDVCSGDMIAGGETPKTRGLRLAFAEAFDGEFAKLSALKELCLEYCRPGAAVRIINDGHMAAFTSAAELCFSGKAPASDTIAHTLGTDMGFGWLRSDGSVPGCPTEFYDLILDLGCRDRRSYPAEDIRSSLNENSGLADARRMLGQSAAFRAGASQDPGLLEGFVNEEGGVLKIISSPDMRKPCLARLMELAASGDAFCADIFRQIGRDLGYMEREIDHIIAPGSRERLIFGRFVKVGAVFELLREGCLQTAPDIVLIPADEDLSASPVMRELAMRTDGTVAQFGQAAGAVYYAAMEVAK